MCFGRWHYLEQGETAIRPLCGAIVLKDELWVRCSKRDTAPCFKCIELLAKRKTPESEPGEET
jgi:hypothetical protein